MTKGSRYRRQWGRGGLALLMLMVVTGVSGTSSTAFGDANPALLMSGQQVAELLGQAKVVILDARAPQQYATDHIPGAVNLPVAAITRTMNGIPGMLAPLAEVEQALGQSGVSRDSHVVIYDDIGAVPATRLFWVLDYLGHPRLSLLQGGLALWRQEGRPVTRAASPPSPTRYEAQPDATRVADRAWVQAHLQQPAVVILDARSPAEFAGQAPGAPPGRGGHIPGAVNVNWVQNLTAAEPHQFQPVAALAQLYQGAGVTPENEIVVYCQSGMRASHDYFVLRLLGYSRVRLYDGSYIEWSADATLPVER